MPKRKTKKRQMKPSNIPLYVIFVLVILAAAFMIVGGLYACYYTKIIHPIERLEQNQAVLQQEIEDLKANTVEEVN